MSTSDRFWFLFVAYSVIWVLLAGFLVRLGRGHRALERDLKDLEERMARSLPR